MSSYVQLQSSTGKILELDREALGLSILITDIADDRKDEPIPIREIDGSILEKVVEWCNHHKTKPSIAKQGDYLYDFKVDDYDEKFMGDNQNELVAIILAANYLDMESLFMIACKILSVKLRGMPEDEIRAIFTVKDGHGQPLLPGYDVWARLIHFLDIRDAELVLAIVYPAEGGCKEGQEMREMVLSLRFDPRFLFRGHFREPDTVLDLLRCTNTVLSGSRATEYYCRGAATTDSDWDFYCPSTPMVIGVFTYIMETLGVKWEDSVIKTKPKITRDGNHEPGVIYGDLGFKVLQGSLKSADHITKIQCIWSTTPNLLPHDCISLFHSSAVQCFISGFCACSLYDKYTSHRETIHWVNNDKYITRGLPQPLHHSGHLVRDRKTLEIVEHVTEGKPDSLYQCTLPEKSPVVTKYTERGFKFVQHLSRDPGDRTTTASDSYHIRLRSLGDEGSRMIDFAQYLEHENWNIPFASYIAAAKYVWWTDEFGMTQPIQTPLKQLNFPPQANCGSRWEGRNQVFDALSNKYLSRLLKDRGKRKVQPWLFGKRAPPEPVYTLGTWISESFAKEEFDMFSPDFALPF